MINLLKSLFRKLFKIKPKETELQKLHTKILRYTLLHDRNIRKLNVFVPEKTYDKIKFEVENARTFGENEVKGTTEYVEKIEFYYEGFVAVIRPHNAETITFIAE